MQFNSMENVRATEYGWYLSILICKYCTSLFSKMCYFFYGIFYWLNVEGIIEILVKGEKFHLTQHLHFGGHHVYLHIFMLHRFTSINLKRHLPHITLLHRWNLDFSVAEKTVLNYKGHYAGFCMKTLLAVMLWSGMRNLFKRWKKIILEKNFTSDFILLLSNSFHEDSLKILRSQFSKWMFWIYYKFVYKECSVEYFSENSQLMQSWNTKYCHCFCIQSGIYDRNYSSKSPLNGYYFQKTASESQ